MPETHYHLFNRYVRGQCTPEEAERVLDWLGTPEGEKHLAAQIERDLEQMGRVRTPVAAPPSVWESIRGAVREGKTPSLFPRRLLAVAASVTLLLAVAYWLLPRPLHSVSYRTGYGETKEIILPEGSKVVLNGNSALTFKNTWSAGEPREVWLDGEAFFAVAHRPDDQKFVVTTPGELRVEVLGTQFNVYQRQQKTKVSLNSGKVRLRLGPDTPTGSLVMQPDELVEFDSRSEQITRKKVNAEMYSSWKNKKLIFERTSLRDIAQVLQDTYGLSVVVTDSALLKQQFSGTIPNENVDILLDGLSGLFDLKIARRGNTVQFDNR